MEHYKMKEIVAALGGRKIIRRLATKENTLRERREQNWGGEDKKKCDSSRMLPSQTIASNKK